jgi:hypothetical protein
VKELKSHVHEAMVFRITEKLKQELQKWLKRMASDFSHSRHAIENVNLFVRGHVCFTFEILREEKHRIVLTHFSTRTWSFRCIPFQIGKEYTAPFAFFPERTSNDKLFVLEWYDVIIAR